MVAIILIIVLLLRVACVSTQLDVSCKAFCYQKVDMESSTCTVIAVHTNARQTPNIKSAQAGKHI